MRIIDIDIEALTELQADAGDFQQPEWDISPEDLAAWQAELFAEVPFEALPTAEEVETMAKALGADELPF